MAKWRVEADSGRRWVEASTVTGAWTADIETRESLRQAAGTSVPLAPMAELYRPTGNDDPVWLYLAARHILGPVTVTGRPPELPLSDPRSTPAGSVT